MQLSRDLGHDSRFELKMPDRGIDFCGKARPLRTCRKSLGFGRKVFAVGFSEQAINTHDCRIVWV
jgi:hypothetical protein